MASVFVLALAGVLVAVAWAAGSVVALLVAHREAQSAADLTALAAAQRVADGDGGCDAAASIATANKATLLSCVNEGRAVLVEVEIRVPGRGAVHARARAGPG